ncbi:hypothetical protein [Streptomyces rubellomurinus]|uniref:Uncharacterized protein n=2 Tax=Streptomyces TaxID=1883 RepID=A0A0F2TCE0_STRR3|nr:hypothetical protein [Streptomyces rubellomurinus]KJS55410.1 hypothetical protein VM98_13315 [Streptomyces rubellomurinus subsp. indigoferus]KJS59970.1 hypothetical protein VM95_23885 [Streptomyces rubellomurinus]
MPEFYSDGRQIMALESGDHIWYYDGQGNEFAISGEQTSTDLNIPRLQWFSGADPNDPNDYRNNGIHIFNFVIYDSEIRRGQPHLRTGAGSHAWLNNNPGNLTGVPGGPDFGQFPNKFNWHHFLIFPDHDTGFAAIASFLGQGPYPTLSILEAFRKYAPASDGNTPDQYAADVAASAQVSTDTLVGDLTSDQMQAMQSKIEAIEGTIPGTTLQASEAPQVIQDLINGA